MSEGDAAPAHADSLPLDSQIAQRHVVKELLGRGGMGDVYRVFDTARGRDVALKLLRTARERDPARRTQRLSLFQREYYTLCDLAHPRIIEAYDYGFEQGAPYYTMELLQGSDAGKLAPLAWRDVCALLRDVASALTLLHSRRLLHRDLSPSNVHQQPDGSFKLIDFGAMSGMGKPSEVVGTPPFMAPELLRQDTLDGRADLYSLAALSYYVLTGHTVYPVRSLADRYNFVDMRPKPPSTHAVALPPALDELLLQLLSPDPAGRPVNTIEVLERLSAIDGVGLNTSRRSALPVRVTTPGLIGRDTELATVRRRFARGLRARGACLLVTGSGGSGRSRFLDACALEARLAGARVLRAAADLTARPCGVLSTLLQQLSASQGSFEREAHPLPEDVRALVMTPSVEQPAPARWASVQSALVSYLVRVAERRTLVLVVDDLERADVESGAVIAQLAQRTQTDNLILLAAVERDQLAEAPEFVRSFREHARELELAPLSLAETEGMLASVFGSVPNLAPLATRIHGLSAGSPRLTMELAQHLVNVGVIRCETGGYLLPELISPRDLPSSLGEVLRLRVRALSREAQALANVLACAATPLAVELSLELAELTPPRAEAALHELCEAEIGEQRGSDLVLRQPALVGALRTGLSAEALSALHARLAASLARDPARMVAAAEHYFAAGLEREAVDTLLAVTASTAYAGRTWHAGYAPLVKRAVEACARLGRPACDAFSLQSTLAYQVVLYNEPCDRDELLAFARRLTELCGLTDFHALSAELPYAERVAKAMARAEARYRDTSEHERTVAPNVALRQLVGYMSKVVGFASMTLDHELMAALPSLAAFAPLSPTIGAVELLSSSLRDMLEGRLEGFMQKTRALIDRLGQPDGAGLPTVEAQSFSVNVLYGMALVNAALGLPAVFEQVCEMEKAESQRINAWRVRQNAHIFLADLEQAEVSAREVERLTLLDGSRQVMQGGTVETEALAYRLNGDLSSLRRVMPAIEAMAARHRGWQLHVFLTRAAQLRARGQHAEALAQYEGALAQMPVARHRFWTFAAAGQLDELTSLGRAQEACDLGVPYVERCRAQQGLGLSLHPLELALADAEAAVGRVESARTRVEGVLSALLGMGVRGLHLGVAHETAAKVALAAGDAPAFARHYAAAAQHLGHGRNAALTARLDRLLDRARAAQVAPTRDAIGSDGELSLPLVMTQLSQCEPGHRPTQALELLLVATGASAGHLYRVTDDGISELASSSELPAPTYLREFLLRYLASAEVVNDHTVDVSCHTSISEANRTIEPVLLSSQNLPGRRIVAVAALCFVGGRRWPDPQLIAAIAEQLAVA